MSKISLSGMFRHKGSYSALIYSLVALLLLLLQCAPHGFPTLFHVRPAPLVPFVVCVAILEGARAGVMIGTFSGLLWGIYSFRLFGMDALLLMALGLAAGPAGGMAAARQLSLGTAAVQRGHIGAGAVGVAAVLPAAG